MSKNVNAKQVNFDDLKKMVSDFQTIRLLNDETNMIGLQVQGRSILYNQLAEAYRIGLILLTRGNGTMFCHLMESNGMADQSKKYGNNNYTNAWNFVTHLLYGEWKEKNVSKTVFEVYERNRSAEKYSKIFRYLDDKKVAAENAADFILNFTHDELGNGLIGIERADTEANRKASDKKQMSEQAIAVGTNAKEADVFTFDAPTELADVKYGSCFFEVIDGKVVVFGTKKLEEAEFNELAAKRGRTITMEWNRKAKEADKLAKQSKSTFTKAVKLIKTDPELEALKKRLLGDKEWAQWLLDDKKESKKNAESTADYASRMKSLYNLFDNDCDEPAPKKLIALVKNVPASQEVADV
ncbi:hypothetical protein [Sphingopyxis panaciterrulae]|uniref:Uncharacterized protein n=1 Tax=Sphingopyxis panaciterrulae TaxID=462372 RepID=A0A7W9B2V7_9SPHN|nr:hypothetical protein [Sphingopyxis panaciterrulae]MBB5705218.1 hypothetical protein [Sphingopyxis panaciterrulae]